MSKIPKNNGVAQAALGRKPTAMKHRNAPRGGARNEEADIIAETDEAEGVCRPGCNHQGVGCQVEDAAEVVLDDEEMGFGALPMPWDLALMDDSGYGDWDE